MYEQAEPVGTLKPGSDREHNNRPRAPYPDPPGRRGNTSGHASCNVEMYEQAAPVRTPQAGSDREQNNRPRTPYPDPSGRRGNTGGHAGCNVEMYEQAAPVRTLQAESSPTGNKRTGRGHPTQIPRAAEMYEQAAPVRTLQAESSPTGNKRTGRGHPTQIPRAAEMYEQAAPVKTPQAGSGRERNTSNTSMTSFFRVRPGSPSTSGLRSSSPPPNKTRRGEAPRIPVGLFVRGDRGCRGVEPVDRRAVAEQVRFRRPAQRCKVAAPLVLMKEGSQSVAILAVGNSGTPNSNRTRRRSKGTVGYVYRCSSPRKQQPNERCPDSSDRLEARCNLKDASTLCYAVLRCVVGTRGLRCRLPVTQKAVRRRVRSRVLATQKAVRRPARARVPVTQKAIRRREAACR
ncbi:hypothetical protein Bbelb_394590 [Branchiostoma belcheri]|nr:hypothetical protein Bbelb_394590 [Branchiostoma belcheri]